jgi:hypothetical protein
MQGYERNKLQRNEVDPGKRHDPTIGNLSGPDVHLRWM